jgi:hypothetical protein
MENDGQRLVASLREEYSRRVAAASLEQLNGGSAETPFQVDLWSLMPAELDQEMASRLSSLNEDIDSSPRGPITSHRRFIGKPIALAKWILRCLATPYTRLLLARQIRFNEDLVAFHLASFIRVRRLEEHNAELTRQVNELRDAPEQQAPVQSHE